MGVVSWDRQWDRLDRRESRNRDPLRTRVADPASSDVGYQHVPDPIMTLC
jgi:hypothetical protein